MPLVSLYCKVILLLYDTSNDNFDHEKDGKSPFKIDDSKSTECKPIWPFHNYSFSYIVKKKNGSSTVFYPNHKLTMCIASSIYKNTPLILKTKLVPKSMSFCRKM